MDPMENLVRRVQMLLAEAGSNAYERLVNILPEAVLAIAIVLVGWLIASLLYFFCVRILKFFAVDKLAGKTPLDRMLKNMGIQKGISEILALLVFWMAVLVTLIFASEILNLHQVSMALTAVTRYIPQVIGALLIVIFGMLLAKFLQMLAVQTVAKMELGYEKSVGKGVNILVLIFVFLAASEQLGFDLSFITTNVLIVLSAVLIVVGLGIILGSRTLLEGAVASKQLQHQLKEGDEIEIDGHKGVLKEFTNTGVILSNGNNEIVLPATLFYTQTYTLNRKS